MATVEETLAELQRQQERAEEEERRRAELASRRNQILRAEGKHLVKQFIKKRAVQGITRAGLAAASPALLWTLAIVGGLAMLIGSFFLFVILPMATICYQSGLNGTLARAASAYTLPVDVCGKLSFMKDIVQYIDQANPL